MKPQNIMQAFTKNWDIKEDLSPSMIYGLLQRLFNRTWLFLHMMNTSKPLTKSEAATVWSISYSWGQACIIVFTGGLGVVRKYLSAGVSWKQRTCDRKFPNDVLDGFGYLKEFELFCDVRIFGFPGGGINLVKISYAGCFQIKALFHAAERQSLTAGIKPSYHTYWQLPQAVPVQPSHDLFFNPSGYRYTSLLLLCFRCLLCPFWDVPFVSPTRIQLKAWQIGVTHKAFDFLAWYP